MLLAESTRLLSLKSLMVDFLMNSSLTLKVKEAVHNSFFISTVHG
jgi:hypothetical protein